jgi:heme exporter protein C
MKFIKTAYKALSIILLFYAVIAGFLFDVPQLIVIGESIRNLYFHVGMWFSMITLLIISVFFSIRYLKTNKLSDDTIAHEAVNTAVVFGLLGIITGMVWAKTTWGHWWVNDPKLNGAAITMLAYLAYKILRGSVKNEVLTARISSIYNILAFVMMLVFMMILPRTIGNSIHPGQGGNPALNPTELDNSMRLVFYPALLGWILLSIWILEIRVRLGNLKSKSEQKD